MKRQLMRLETTSVESPGQLSFLSDQERERLKSGDCRCYLARDLNGAVTLFLATSFRPGEAVSVVRSEYSRSHRPAGGETILRESGMKRFDRTKS